MTYEPHKAYLVRKDGTVFAKMAVPKPMEFPAATEKPKKPEPPATEYDDSGPSALSSLWPLAVAVIVGSSNNNDS